MPLDCLKVFICLFQCTFTCMRMRTPTPNNHAPFFCLPILSHTNNQHHIIYIFTNTRRTWLISSLLLFFLHIKHSLSSYLFNIKGIHLFKLKLVWSLLIISSRIIVILPTIRSSTKLSSLFRNVHSSYFYHSSHQIFKPWTPLPLLITKLWIEEKNTRKRRSLQLDWMNIVNPVLYSCKCI